MFTEHIKNVFLKNKEYTRLILVKFISALNYKDKASPKNEMATDKKRRKKEIRSFFNTTHKNKLKVDYRPKCETRYY